MSTDLVSVATETLDPTVLAPTAGDPRTSASVRTPMQNLTNRTRWLWARTQDVIGYFAPLGAVLPVAITSVDTSGDTLTLAAHGFSNGDPVVLVPAGGATLPAPFVVGVTYYAKSVTSTTFQLGATAVGAALDITTTGSGAFYAAKRTTANLYGVALLAAAANAFSGLMTIAGSLTVTGAAAFGAALSAVGLASFPGGSTVGNFNSNAGPLTAYGTISQQWRYNERPTVLLGDADHTIGSSDGDQFAMAVPTAQRTILLRETTAPTPVDTEVLTITRPAGGAFAIVIKREGNSGAAIVTLAASTRSTACLKESDLNDGNGVRWHLDGGWGHTPGADA